MIKFLLQIIFTFLVTCFVTISNAHSQLADDLDGGQVTTLMFNEQAPFAGTLLDVNAVAKVITNLRSCKSDCDARLTFSLEKQKNDFKLQLDSCQLKLESQSAYNVKVLKLKDEHIAQLQKLNVPLINPKEDTEWYKTPHVVLGTGIVLGTGLTLLSVYVYSKYAN